MNWLTVRIDWDKHLQQARKQYRLQLFVGHFRRIVIILAWGFAIAILVSQVTRVVLVVVAERAAERESESQRKAARNAQSRIVDPKATDAKTKAGKPQTAPAPMVRPKPVALSPGVESGVNLFGLAVWVMIIQVGGTRSRHRLHDQDLPDDEINRRYIEHIRSFEGLPGCDFERLHKSPHPVRIPENIWKEARKRLDDDLKEGMPGLVPPQSLPSLADPFVAIVGSGTLSLGIFLLAQDGHVDLSINNLIIPVVGATALLIAVLAGFASFMLMYFSDYSRIKTFENLDYAYHVEYPKSADQGDPRKTRATGEPSSKGDASPSTDTDSTGQPENDTGHDLNNNTKSIDAGSDDNAIEFPVRGTRPVTKNGVAPSPNGHHNGK